MKLNKIKGNPKNPRIIKKSNLERLVMKILRGYNIPKYKKIFYEVTQDGNIILAGNQRHKAYSRISGYPMADLKKRLDKIFGREESPEKTEALTIFAQIRKSKSIPDEWTEDVSSLSKSQKDQLVIIDNISDGEWDAEKLKEEWDLNLLDDWGLNLDWKSIEKPKAKDDGFKVPKKELLIEVEQGDIFEFVIDDRRHRLICGSSTDTDVLAALFNVFGGSKADAVITDPPYNVNYVGKTKDALTIKNDKMDDDQFYRFLFDFYKNMNAHVHLGGAWYVWHADSEGAAFRYAMKNAGIKVAQCLIWVKDVMVMGRQDYQWQHEPCLYGWKKGAGHKWYSDRKQTTVLNFKRPKASREHPTMKPIPLIGYQIENSTMAGDIVADGFLGSGTTMVAAEQLKRNCYGCELDPKYCKVIIKRMLDLNADIIVLRNDTDITNDYRSKLANVA